LAKRVINSLNAGELSPYLYARSDFEKYGSGCLVMENFVPLPYGGAIRRPAIEYLGDSKQDDAVRLIPFIASIEASYMLEFGDGYLRFWKDGAIVDDGSVPVEIGTPYADADLVDLKITQSVDVMWIVHPDYPVQRLSRFSNTSWTLVPEEFDYPPLKEENTTDITMSPSATTGTITLTSSQEFFDSGHVDSYMAFDSTRTIDNATRSSYFTGTAITEDLYVSNADWEFSSTGTWSGRLVAQRSLDNGTSWEDYVVIGDTTGVASGGQKNFSFATDSPEPTNARIRISYTAASGTMNYQLKTTDPWRTLVKITGYTDSENVVAEVMDEFQDVASDYSSWATSTAYVAGDLVKQEESLDYVSGSAVTLSSIDSGLVDITGMDFADGSFWFCSGGASNIKVYRVDSGLTTLEDSFAVNHYLTAANGIAYYSGHLYVLGYTSSKSRVIKYTVDGDLVGMVYNDGYTLQPKHKGLGYYNNYFYMDSYDTIVNNRLRKWTTSFIWTGVGSGIVQQAHYFLGGAGIDGRIYSINGVNDSIDVFSPGLTALTSFDVSSETVDPQGITYDGTNVCICSTTTFYKYDLVSRDSYYECVKDHTSGIFSTDYDNGYWAIRTPKMTTWTEGAFSDYRGHPSAVALFENRLCYAGTASELDTVWASKIEDYATFLLGDLDTDAMKLVLGSGQNDEVRGLVPQESLIAGTVGGEWVLEASDERKSITPTGYNLKRKSTYGTSGLQGLLVNNAVLFPMRQGREVREWFNQWETKDPASDLSILAEHITEGGISQWAYQQQPDNILWSIRADGTLLGFTYERDQNVVGWHRHLVGVTEASTVPVGTFDGVSGTGDYVSLASEITLGDSFGIHICGYFDSGTGAWDKMFSTRSDSGEGAVWMDRHSSTNNARLILHPVGGVQNPIFLSDLFDDAWHDVRIEYDTGVCDTWVDGVKTTEAIDHESGFTSASDSFQIMAVNGGGQATGKLALFSVDGEFWYEFADGTGTTLTDKFGLNNGTVSVGAGGTAVFWANTRTIAASNVEFESNAVLPRQNDEDAVYVSCKIKYGSKYKRVIGRFNNREWGTSYTTDWEGSDFYVSYTSPGTATLTGLDHLEGRTVAVVADGVVKENEIVYNGQIVIDSDAYSYVVVGLPFKSTVAPMYVDIDGQYGTSKGNLSAGREATIRFKDTYSAKVGRTGQSADLEDVIFDNYSSPLYSGDFPVWFDSSDEFLLSCYVVQDEPMPCTVLAMIPKLEVEL